MRHLDPIVEKEHEDANMNMPRGVAEPSRSVDPPSIPDKVSSCKARKSPIVPWTLVRFTALPAGALSYNHSLQHGRLQAARHTLSLLNEQPAAGQEKAEALHFCDWRKGL